MICHTTLHIRSYAGGANVIGKCSCGLKTGELVYLLPSERDGTLEAAQVLLKLLHQERVSKEGTQAGSFSRDA